MQKRKFIGRTLGWCLQSILWIWAGARFIMDWVGRAALPDDIRAAQGMLEKAALWLFATPWWVPGLLAALLTLFLVVYLGHGVLPAQEKSANGEKPQDVHLTPENILEKIVGKTYKNCKVKLDGKKFYSCRFEDVTFRWDGDTFFIVDCYISPYKRFETANASFTDLVTALKHLGFLIPEFAKDWKYTEITDD